MTSLPHFQLQVSLERFNCHVTHIPFVCNGVQLKFFMEVFGYAKRGFDYSHLAVLPSCHIWAKRYTNGLSNNNKALKGLLLDSELSLYNLSGRTGSV